MELTARLLGWTALLVLLGVGASCTQAPLGDAPDNSQAAASTDGADDPQADTDDGWLEFEEPIGDESEVAIRLTPQVPKAGEPVKVEVKAGSVYGRFRGKVWSRVGDPAQFIPAADSAAGGPWQELKEVGGSIMDLQSEEMVPLGTTREDPHSEQPGETHYEGSLTFPAAGKASVDLKFAYESDPDSPLAFQAWSGDVQ